MRERIICPTAYISIVHNRKWHKVVFDRLPRRSDCRRWLPVDYQRKVVLPVGLSCLFGLAISFFGFSCRRAISATGFTVLGIVNKLLTVVINLVIWDKHSTFVGTVGLLICMIGGIMYQQSTSNKPKAVAEASSPESELEQQKLLEMQSIVESNDVEKQVTEESNDVEKQITDSGEAK